MPSSDLIFNEELCGYVTEVTMLRERTFSSKILAKFLKISENFKNFSPEFCSKMGY